MQLKVVRGRVRVRDDNGPTGELLGEELFIEHQGRYYPLRWLLNDAGVAVLPYQIEIVEDNRNPYATRSTPQLKDQSGILHLL